MGVFADILGFRGTVQGYQDRAKEAVVGPVKRQLEQQQYDLEQKRVAALLQQQGLGYAQQLNREGMQANPEAQRAVGLMQNPGSRAAGVAVAGNLLGNLTPEQRTSLEQRKAEFTGTQAAQQTQWDKTNEQSKKDYQLRVANMGMDQAVKVSAANETARNNAWNSQEKLADDFRTDPVVQKSGQALTAYDQLRAALKQNDPTALGSAIVAITQVQEPGLAVRTDDRVRYTGSNPLIAQLAQAVNTWSASGTIDPLIKGRMENLGTRLVIPHAKNYERVAKGFQQTALATPRANPDLVTVGSGVDTDLVKCLLFIDQKLQELEKPQ